MLEKKKLSLGIHHKEYKQQQNCKTKYSYDDNNF